MQHYIVEEIQKLSSILMLIQNDRDLLAKIESVAQLFITTIKNGGKILFAGNGGSAADAQHLAAELVCRYTYDRPGLPGIALTTDTSALTAIANDYAFDYLFARQIEALGQANDVFIGISTSGKSANILKALECARKKQLITVGFTGVAISEVDDYADITLHVPSTETAKIQECHILFGHIICSLMQDSLFKNKYQQTNIKKVSSVSIA